MRHKIALSAEQVGAILASYIEQHSDVFVGYDAEIYITDQTFYFDVMNKITHVAIEVEATAIDDGEGDE